ncbi:MAG: hypothetical protein QOC60_1248, partial [Frankiaceae bacterium]|nr:hypothetical protein [Frankiaceae bacterium]
LVEDELSPPGGLDESTRPLTAPELVDPVRVEVDPAEMESGEVLPLRGRGGRGAWQWLNAAKRR